MRLPPGPKGHWLLGHLPAMRRDPLGTLSAAARDHGDVALLRYGPRPLYVVSSPPLIEEVLTARAQSYRKHLAVQLLRPILGNGLLNNEGDDWRRQRRLAAPAFHKKRIEAYADTMVRATTQRLEHWRDGETRDVHFDMMDLTLAIVGKTLFDTEVDAEVAALGGAMAAVQETFTVRINRLLPLPEVLPLPANLRMWRAVRVLDRFVYAAIAERRRNPGDRGDLLSMLLAAQDEEDGKGMSDRQLRDEMMTFFLAGHETTALTLSWTFALLARHPEVYAELENELDAVLGGRAPTLADVPKLPYADAVLKESMRLYPAAWVFGREAVEATTVGDYDVAKGTTVVMSPWVIHRRPNIYLEPETFRPERWSQGLADRLPRFAYVPFGGGQRLCIGNNFAMLEAILILATVAQRYRMELARDQFMATQPDITLRPKGGMRLVLHRRAKVAATPAAALLH